MRLMLVECPRCHRIHRITPTSGGTTCDCHLYCSEGARPIDCSVATTSWNDDFGWPAGAHGADLQEGDDVRHRVRYCSTHDNYIYKTAIFLEVDRRAYSKQRLPKHLTTFQR